MIPPQGEAPAPAPVSRAWYRAPVRVFCEESPDSIIGKLAINNAFDLVLEQKSAWIKQIDILKHELSGFEGTLFFEFNVPRMGKRIDAVLLSGPVVFVLEFKVGATEFESSALDQAWDYALDLKNFHQGSHEAVILPILIATGSKRSSINFTRDADGVFRPIAVGSNGLRSIIDTALEAIEGSTLDPDIWADSSYKPTPTIIEAARSLYAQHSVEAITQYLADKKNLRVTSRRIEELVDQASERKEKLICFVTGVPGAGKTLVGLNLATRHRDEDEPNHAVFLSGNGPLVAVLREALIRDEVERKRNSGEKALKKDVGRSVKAFIQNVHHFRDDALETPAAPAEHVVIFDESQRAWDLRQTASFMHRKKGRPNFAQSEPEFLISCMDRHKEWAVIICLVGGGQEINTGEAGIGAWIAAIHSQFPEWHMYISDRLTEDEYAAGIAIDEVRARAKTEFDDNLHLSVSMRSFRAEHVSSFVKALLDCETGEASRAFSQLRNRYPILVTRCLPTAKKWLKSRARGSERFGLVASSKAQRLKPHAIDIRVDVDPVPWFLNDRDDTRSSYYLEDAATEFQVQGLELDWACVTWDGDFRFNDGSWSFHDFRGNKWQNVNNETNRSYLKNAYRVLLTRARQGMVIFVPPGDSEDATRSPDFYDSTFRYLTEIGIPELPAG